MPFGPATHSRAPIRHPAATGMAVLMFALSLPALGDEEQESYVRVIECDGEQYVQIVTDPSQAFSLEDPCSLIEKPRPNPSNWICAGGTCFPRTFIVAPPPRPQPGPTAPLAPQAPMKTPSIKAPR